jgi:glutamate 5-kinase
MRNRLLNNADEIIKAGLVVVKIGSSSITGENAQQLQLVAELVARLRAKDISVVVVSSGAIASSGPILGLTAKATDLPTSQAMAAVGQLKLMADYQRELSKFDLIAGQVLLTVENMDNSQTRSNAIQAFSRLIEMGVVPIVNENDTVATQEIRFGDNDGLAANVASLLDADLLILLSDVDAIYTSPPDQEGSSPISRIRSEKDLQEVKISGASTGFGTGGALTKVSAALKASEAGIPVMLTSVANSQKILTDEFTHTWFEAKNKL